jgi:hypothetical protein
LQSRTASLITHQAAAGSGSIVGILRRAAVAFQQNNTTLAGQ